MNAARIRIPGLLLGALACIGGSAFAADANPPQPITVGQLRADPDRYLERDFVIKGYVRLRYLNITEGSTYLVDSKAVSDWLDKYNLDGNWDIGSVQLHSVEAKSCVTLWNIEPLRRRGNVFTYGKFYNNRTVVLRARLERRDEEIVGGCSSSLILIIEQVLDPAPRATLPHRSQE